jgi:hypothetical protein
MATKALNRQASDRQLAYIKSLQMEIGQGGLEVTNEISSDAVFTLEAFQYDPDFLFRIEFAADFAFVLSNHRSRTFTGFRFHLVLLSRS